MSANTLVATLLAMSGQRNIITVPRAFVRFTGSLESAMMLNQLLYWKPRAHGEAIYKTNIDWADELCLTRYAVRKARERLAAMEFLTFATHHVKGAPAVHYTIDFDVLVDRWTSWLQGQEVKCENELYEPPSKVRKRTLPDESSSKTNRVKFENEQTMNHRVPTEITDSKIGGGGGAREPVDTDPMVALFARYDITQAEPLARLYRKQWPDVTVETLTRLCERLSEPESGSYAGARLYRKLKAGPYERHPIRSPTDMRPLNLAREIDRPFQQILSASPAQVGKSPTTDGDRRACPCCAEMQHAVPIRHYNGSTFFVWSVCQAMQRAWNATESHLAARRSDLEKRQLEAEKAMGDPGLSQIARFSLTDFDPDRLRVAFGDDNPLDVVTNWLTAIKDLPHGEYRQPDGQSLRGPPVALHLYYAGKGTGKTHLAAGAALAARAMGKLTVFLEEVSYLERTWAADFGDKEQLSMLPGETAWLTVLDDIGQNPPGRDPRALQKAWYNIINRRWLKAGWTIITSNRTLDELMDQRTLSEAAHSRLHQMTRGEVVLMEADDQRLRGKT